ATPRWVPPPRSVDNTNAAPPGRTRDRRTSRAADYRGARRTEGRRPIGGKWAPPQQCFDWGESGGTAKSEWLRSVPQSLLHGAPRATEDFDVLRRLIRPARRHERGRSSRRASSPVTPVAGAARIGEFTGGIRATPGTVAIRHKDEDVPELDRQPAHRDPPLRAESRFRRHPRGRPRALRTRRRRPARLLGRAGP